MDRGAWRAIVHGFTKSLTQGSMHTWIYPHPPASPNTLQNLSFLFPLYLLPYSTPPLNNDHFLWFFFYEVKFTNTEILKIFALHFWQLDTPREPTFPSQYGTLLPSQAVLLISLSPRQPLTWLISALINSASSRTFCKWKHTVDTLLWLSSFVQDCICEIHPSGCLYW